MRTRASGTRTASSRPRALLRAVVFSQRGTTRRAFSGAAMPNDMGTFRVDIEIENPARPGQRRTLRSVLVDTGAELSWVPAEVLEALGVERNNQWRFRQANGTVLERWTGIVVITVAGKRTGDDVVFGEPGDLTLLGARTLQGLNFRVEPVTKQLVDAGPAPAAVLVLTP